MDDIPIFRGVIIGHSMGGAIALTLAQQYPERIVGLGLVGSGARLRVDPLILENTSSQATFPVAVQTIMERAFSSSTDPKLIELAAKYMKNTRPSVLHSDFTACNTFDIMDNITKIRFPTLVICGQDDQLTPVRYSQFIASQIPKAELRIISDAGHMVMLEQPQIVANEISSFLRTLTYTPG
jgi:pimeloyl-ACP methyl ester carboxylesterase